MHLIAVCTAKKPAPGNVATCITKLDFDVINSGGKEFDIMINRCTSILINPKSENSVFYYYLFQGSIKLQSKKITL